MTSFSSKTKEPVLSTPPLDAAHLQDWSDSLADVARTYGRSGVAFLLSHLAEQAAARGLMDSTAAPFALSTPYVNTLRAEEQPAYPGDPVMEARLGNIFRWNAMAIVVKANKAHSGIGGHIATYASVSTLFEVGFNHFFRGHGDDFSGDQIFFQGHASPGIYARAFALGRLSEGQLLNFRRELEPGGGLSSYPHPWLMPNFWEFPTVSMGLAPLSAIYQARFNRYLHNRQLKDTSKQRVWAFLGDGEMDEPETTGAIHLASREKLSNLTFIVNCNLQRLDGPVRGNGKIVQELEGLFRGAGWNVIKVLWSSEWDALFARDGGPDGTGKLVKRLTEIVDGELQNHAAFGASYLREKFFDTDPDLAALIEGMSDEALSQLKRGGHDFTKVYAAYRAAVESPERPTVILAHTVKGFGMGASGEARNVAHQQKKLEEEDLQGLSRHLGLPMSPEAVQKLEFYRLAPDSPEVRYLQARRAALGGDVPGRTKTAAPMEMPGRPLFEEFLKGSSGRAVSTTMAFVRVLTKLLAHREVGRYVVPIVPDEARTFGMESLFGQYGIYAPFGQKYEPVDRKNLLYYREITSGQVLEEGITEAGAMASWIAAGTAYATHGVPTIPFYIFYSMFGFQRIGDLIWAAADAKARGFLLGATAGRTTLMGEGLQHQDGHSHILALSVPNCMAYDPAYACEVALIVEEGLRRMYQGCEPLFYYLTLGNENYDMPALPPGAEEGVIKGMYRFNELKVKKGKLQVQLIGSGAILGEVLKAQTLLAEEFGVSSTVWSATSYKELRRDALETQRRNMLNPTAVPERSYVESLLADATGPFIAASDYMRTYPEQIAPWVPGGLFALGTDGFGRSETRESLRRFFEVDAASIVVAALYCLAKQGAVKPKVVSDAIQRLGVKSDLPAPWNR